ncbi:hypothetical protein ACFL6C_09965, partial [Myxococcota bacterium]
REEPSGQLRFKFTASTSGEKDGRRKWIPWADLAARTFEIDVLECPRCSYRPMRVVSVIPAPTMEELAAATAFSSTTGRSAAVRVSSSGCVTAPQLVEDDCRELPDERGVVYTDLVFRRCQVVMRHGLSVWMRVGPGRMSEIGSYVSLDMAFVLPAVMVLSTAILLGFADSPKTDGKS